MEHCEHIVGGGPQALADFGCVPRSSDGLRGSRIFCHANNARFHRFPSDPWDKFYNIWTQQSIGTENFLEQKFEKFTTRVFSKKNKNC